MNNKRIYRVALVVAGVLVIIAQCVMPLAYIWAATLSVVISVLAFIAIIARFDFCYCWRYIAWPLMVAVLAVGGIGFSFWDTWPERRAVFQASQRDWPVTVRDSPECVRGREAKTYFTETEDACYRPPRLTFATREAVNLREVGRRRDTVIVAATWGGNDSYYAVQRRKLGVVSCLREQLLFKGCTDVGEVTPLTYSEASAWMK